MAPALTSNSFLLTPTPPSRRQALKNPKPTFRFLAKQNGPIPPFRIGKREEEDSNQTQGSKPKIPFFFDFVPDAKSLVPVLSKPSTTLFIGNQRRKDPQTVFVTGATGQSGIRIAQTLLRQGFVVRAGVPALAVAQELAQLAATYKLISSKQSKRLNAVESTFQNAEAIAKAIGNAGKVVVTIGPSENGPTNEVTTADALQVIQAAQLAGVTHVAVVYDSSSPSMTSTYNVLDGISTFFSNIFTPSQPPTVTEFLAKVVETDISYTFIKAMVTDDFSTEKSYNVVVKPEGSAGGPNDYKVSKSQLASLVADIFSNTSVAENKVVVVSTSPSAPSKPVDELFSAIPEDGRRKAYAVAQAKAKAEEEAIRASERAREAAEAAKKLEREVKKSKKGEQAVTLAEEAGEKAEATGPSLESIFSRAKNIGGGFSWDKLSSQISASEKEEEEEEAAVEAPEKEEASLESFLNRAKNIGGGFSWAKLSSQISAQKSNEKPKTQVATVRGLGRARTLPRKKAVIKQTSSKTKPKKAELKTEVNNVFGGLFKQETIYIDDD